MDKFILKIKDYIKKRWWYVLLVIASTIYVVYYRYEIYYINPFNARTLIFIIWLILLIFPLFSEIEIGHVKIKKEIEKTQSELKSSMNELRMQLIDMRISNTNNNTLILGQLASEGELNIMRNSVKENQKNDECQENLEEEIPKQTIYLLGIRRTLERELSLLCRRVGVSENKSVSQMIYIVAKNKLIDMDTADILREINGISNRSIHGEIVSEKYVKFVEDVFPKIKERLQRAGENISKKNWFVCTRCHYMGPSEFENVCPQCGFVTDDY